MVQETVRRLRYDCRDQGPDYSSCLRKQQAHVYGNGNVIIYTAHIRMRFMAVYNSFWLGEIKCHLPTHLRMTVKETRGQTTTPRFTSPTVCEKCAPVGLLSCYIPFIMLLAGKISTYFLSLSNKNK